MCGCADECASLCQSQDEGHESDISGVCVCVFAGYGGGRRPADAVEEKGSDGWHLNALLTVFSP